MSILLGCQAYRVKEGCSHEMLWKLYNCKSLVLNNSDHIETVDTKGVGSNHELFSEKLLLFLACCKVLQPYHCLQLAFSGSQVLEKLKIFLQHPDIKRGMNDR